MPGSGPDASGSVSLKKEQKNPETFRVKAETLDASAPLVSDLGLEQGSSTAAHAEGGQAEALSEKLVESGVAEGFADGDVTGDPDGETAEAPVAKEREKKQQGEAPQDEAEESEAEESEDEEVQEGSSSVVMEKQRDAKSSPETAQKEGEKSEAPVARQQEEREKEEKEEEEEEEEVQEKLVRKEAEIEEPDSLGKGDVDLQSQSKNERLSWKARNKRDRALARKTKLRSSAASLWNSGIFRKENEAADHDQPQEDREDEDYQNDIADMVKETLDFLDYTDDKAFIRNFEYAYERLERYAGLKDFLKKNPDIDLSGLGEKHPTVEELTAMAERYGSIRDYYKAKMALIANPNYPILLREDADRIPTDDLAKKTGVDAMDAYHDALLRLRNLEKAGICHTRSNVSIDGSGVHTDHSLHTVEWKGGMDKKKRLFFSVGRLKTDLSTDVSAHSRDDRSKGITRNSSAYKPQEKSAIPAGDTVYATRERVGDATVVGVGVRGSLEFSALEAGYEQRVKEVAGGGKFRSEGSISFLNARASGNIGASLSIPRHGKPDVSVGVQGEGSVSVVSGRIGASLSKDTVAGSFGIDGKVRADVLTASSQLVAKVGKFSLTDAEGKEEEIEGVGFIASTQAALATATASGGITLFGVRIGASISGQVGAVGGTVGYYMGKGKAGLSLGAMLGLGARLDLSIDATYWTDLWTSKLAGWIGEKITGKKLGGKNDSGKDKMEEPEKAVPEKAEDDDEDDDV